MIRKQVINTLYKKYRKLPKSPDCLDFALLFDYVVEHHNITIDLENDCLIINSLEPTSIFHRIPLSRIHAIVPFEEWVAIVLHSSIVFLNRLSPKVAVDLRNVQPSFLDRLRGIAAD